jgi:hypothetical protein
MPVEGGDGSTLSLDFTSGVIDPRLTFTRASDATFINSSGLVQYADANWVRNSTMLVSTNWTATTVNGGTATINGDGSVTFASTAGRITWLQTLGLASGLPITFSIEVTALTAGDIRVSDLFAAGFGFGSQIYHYTSPSGVTQNNISSTAGLGTFGVGLYTVTATTTGTTNNIIFGTDCNGVNRTGSVTIRNPQLQYGTVVPRRVYVPNSSTSSAKWDSARFDYDPSTLQPRGLLIEGSAVNLALRSDDFNTTVTDGTQWSSSGYTAGTLSTTLPDGTTGNARRLSIASGAGSFRSAAITVLASTAYTFSFWARNNGGSQARYRVWNVSAGSSIVDYTLSGSNYVSQIGGANNTSSTWVRVSVSFTTPVGCTSIYVYPCSSDSGTVDLLVWGAQVEAGSGASSYIPTGASTGSRSSDSCSIPMSAFGFVTTGGTFQVNFRRGEFGSTNERSAISTDYVAGRWIGAIHNSGSTTGTLTWWDGTGQLTRTTQTAGANKLAYSFGANAGSGATLQLPVSLSINGSTTSGTFGNGTSNGANVPNLANIAYLVIGAASSSTAAPAYSTANRDFLNNCVSLVKYWPTRLPDAQLTNLTT